MIFRTSIAVILVAAAGICASAQGTFQPRDADEAEAWAIYNKYKNSKAIEAPLESRIKAKFSDAFMVAIGVGAIFGTDREAAAEAKAMKATLDAERKRQAELEAAWDAKFYWRYGDLRWAMDRIRDAKTGREMDRIEFALTYFPFNYKPGNTTAAATPGRNTAVAEKGNAESWSHVRVTMSPVGDLKTEDQPGWRNNGTGFKAVTFGNSPVLVRVDITGKSGVSYFDYTTGITVKTSSGKVLISESPTISKDGGKVSFSATWTPSSADSSLSIRASAAGGNPEGFINYVSGTITMGQATGAGSGSSATNEQADKPVRTSEPTTIFASGNIYGVANGGTPPSFTLSTPTTITQIVSYHWNGGRGAPGGTVALRDANGKTYGPWNVTVRSNVYWEVNQQIKLPPGTYTVLDSDPATWAQNSQSGGKGMVTIKGIQ